MPPAKVRPDRALFKFTAKLYTWTPYVLCSNFTNHVMPLAGAAPVSEEFIAELAGAAAQGISSDGLAAKTINATTYKNTFSRLLHHDLGSVPQATLIEGFFQDIFLTMTNGEQGSGNTAPPTLGPLLVLADAAGLGDAVQNAFMQVRRSFLLHCAHMLPYMRCLHCIVHIVRYLCMLTQLVRMLQSRVPSCK